MWRYMYYHSMFAEIYKDMIFLHSMCIMHERTCLYLQSCVVIHTSIQIICCIYPNVCAEFLQIICIEMIFGHIFTFICIYSSYAHHMHSDVHWYIYIYMSTPDCFCKYICCPLCQDRRPWTISEFVEKHLRDFRVLEYPFSKVRDCPVLFQLQKDSPVLFQLQKEATVLLHSFIF